MAKWWKLCIERIFNRDYSYSLRCPSITTSWLQRPSKGDIIYASESFWQFFLRIGNWRSYLINSGRMFLKYPWYRIFPKTFNSLSSNPTKCPNIQFVGNLPTNCLSVFGYFVGLALKRLNIFRTPHQGCFYSFLGM